jgi:hypothetical protein
MCAQPIEVAHEIVVAPVDVLEARDRRLSFGDESREHQGRRGTNVGSAYRRSHQFVHPANHRVMTFGRNAGPESHQFVDVAKPPNEQVLRDDRDTIGDAQHRGDQRFVVGGDPGIGQGSDVARPQPLRPLSDDPRTADVDASTHGVNLSQQHLHVLRSGVDHAHSPTGDEGRREVRRGHHAVRNDVVVRRLQSFDAVDGEARRSESLNHCAHGDELATEVFHFRFARRVVDHRPSVGEHARH